MFNFNRINFKLVILIIVIALVTFFGGNYLFNHYNVSQPLINELIEMEEIKEVELLTNSGKTDIEIKPDNNIDNFYVFYDRINKIADNHLEDSKGQINILNNSNQHLEKIYHDIHFALYEGISSSEFTVMKDNIDEIINNKQLSEYNLWVDNEKVYLQLVDANNYLYKIVPRYVSSNSLKRGDIDG